MQELKDIIASLSWPHVTLIFGITFLFIFRSQIGGFIQRVRSVGKDGVTTDTEIISQKQDENTINILQHIEIEKSILLDEVEKAICDDLKTRGLDNEGDSIKVLVRNLAVTKINLEHEQTYDTIFGSQIHLLKKLNENTGVGLHKDYLIAFYKTVKEDNEDAFASWELEQYLEYLSARTLITIKQGNYYITDRGQDFLIWLTKHGKPENKGY